MIKEGPRYWFLLHACPQACIHTHSHAQTQWGKKVRHKLLIFDGLQVYRLLKKNVVLVLEWQAICFLCAGHKSMNLIFEMSIKYSEMPPVNPPYLCMNISCDFLKRLFKL